MQYLVELVCVEPIGSPGALAWLALCAILILWQRVALHSIQSFLAYNNDSQWEVVHQALKYPS